MTRIFSVYIDFVLLRHPAVLCLATAFVLFLHFENNDVCNRYEYHVATQHCWPFQKRNRCQDVRVPILYYSGRKCGRIVRHFVLHSLLLLRAAQITMDPPVRACKRNSNNSIMKMREYPRLFASHISMFCHLFIRRVWGTPWKKVFSAQTKSDSSCCTGGQEGQKHPVIPIKEPQDKAIKIEIWKTSKQW